MLSHAPRLTPCLLLPSWLNCILHISQTPEEVVPPSGSTNPDTYIRCHTGLQKHTTDVACGVNCQMVHGVLEYMVLMFLHISYILCVNSYCLGECFYNCVCSHLFFKQSCVCILIFSSYSQAFATAFAAGKTNCQTDIPVAIGSVGGI